MVGQSAFGGIIGSRSPLRYSHRAGLNPEAKVSELIDQSLGEWNVNLIKNIFGEEEAEMICNHH